LVCYQFATKVLARCVTAFRKKSCLFSTAHEGSLWKCWSEAD
jgi:hypothetical protein